MKFKKKPVIIATVSALAVSGSIFVNSTYAADATKQIKAAYANIKVLYNNQQVAVADNQEPFMINGTTYVPLRVLSDAVGKKVTWNNTDKSVSIADTETQVPQGTVDTLNAQIQSLQLQLNNATTQSASKDSTISQLQSQINSLNTQISNLQKDLSNNSSNDVSSTLNSLQRTLNNNYGDYKNTGAKIELTGSKSSLKVTVNNVRETSWNDLSSSNRRIMLQNIVDDIVNNSTFKDSTISGTVYSSSSKQLIAFTVNNSKSVVIGSNVNMDSVQSDLNKNYGTYRGIKLNIELATQNNNEEEVVFRVYANRSDWNSLTQYQVTSLLSSIAADIDVAYNNMGKKIYGFVYDNSNKSTILERYN